MTLSFNALTLPSIHSECIAQWNVNGVSMQHQGIYRLIEENHSFNYQLWLAEDRARRDDMGAEFVYHAKREIDACNQQRNNRMEAIDTWFFNELQPVSPQSCAVHSETPGMIIDRLSILSLKSYHMALQTTRQDVDENHRTQCHEKLNIIKQQQQQLTLCLDALLTDVLMKKRTFRVYHQFKMYNDPTLNPQLYAAVKE